MHKLGMDLGKQYLQAQLGGHGHGSSGGGGGSSSGGSEMTTSEFLKEAKEFAKTKGGTTDC